MAIQLSVNLNKIALIRNSRPGNNPDLLEYAARCINAGAGGITVHPRPDQRHIRAADCPALGALIAEKKHDHPTLEYNIEGNPAAAAETSDSQHSDADNHLGSYPGFMEILRRSRPDQATLVPDADGQLTSDHGFDLRHYNAAQRQQLATTIAEIQQIGCRVSLFIDPDCEQISHARDLGADRIELYTGPYAESVASQDSAEDSTLFEQHCAAAEHAERIGLGVNAGHDLNLHNLPQYRQLPHLREVSIGHSLTIDSLEYGLVDTLQRYRRLLDKD